MATLTTEVVTRAGVQETLYAATGAGDAMYCGSGMYLRVNNGGGSPISVTLVVPSARTYEPNVAISNVVVAVTNATSKAIGPVDSTFADPTTGLCTITYSTATSVTVGAFNLQQP